MGMPCRLASKGIICDVAPLADFSNDDFIAVVMNFDLVEQAIAEGKLWRAKEVLQGRLTAPDFNPNTLRRYGEVLIAMGDKIEAGRALFCSGCRFPEHVEAIELFLSRNPRDNPSRFLSALPTIVRRQAHLAEFIASPEFESKGWTSEVLAKLQPFTPKGPKPPKT